MTSGTSLGLMVAAAGAWSAGLAAFALRRATRELGTGDRSDPSARSRRRWLRTGIPVGYATATVIGFGIGVAVAHGSFGRRLGLGFVGMAMGWLALWFVVVVVLSVRAVWATVHYTERVRPIPPPEA